jgi:hypothetical protein
MTTFKCLVSCLRWPTFLVLLALVFPDKWSVTVFVLALLFRPDLAAALRYRRVVLQGWGFKGCIEGERSSR